MWPRGLKRQAAKIDAWQRELAPSSALRHWYGRDAKRWAAFRTRYFTELRAKGDLARRLRDKARSETVTLLFGARDCARNNAIALKAFLETEDNGEQKV